jgi:hypothetical protein
VLTIQERWRFESIPNQLVIYSSHKPHSPIKWAISHQWHYFGKRRGTNWSRNTQGLLDCQESGHACPWAHYSRPCHTSIITNTRTRVDPGLNSATSFAVERYFIWPAKCEACVQHNKRDEQRSVLNRHKRKLQAPQNPVWLPTTCILTLQWLP